MSLISLKNSSETEVTVLSNRFIDNFMPRANGEFVKVYIYLLRVVSAAPSSFNLEDMADRLLCTDRDISRALKYWEAEKLISLTYTADQQLSGITLLEPGDARASLRAVFPVKEHFPAEQLLHLLLLLAQILFPLPPVLRHPHRQIRIQPAVSLLTG